MKKYYNEKEIVVGEKFNRLTIIKEVDRHTYPSGRTRRKVLCSCDCGSEPKAYMINAVVGGYTKSCGCLNMENITTHGMHSSRQYQCWADMKTRCDNVKHKWYPEYGGRGISYSESWAKFENFWEDMKEGYADDLELDRIDNNSSYCKDNCRWAKEAFQSHNQRKSRGSKNKYIGVGKRDNYVTARIKISGKGAHLGMYDSEELAAKAYDDASEILYGDRPNSTERVYDTIHSDVSERVEGYLNGKSFRTKGTGSGTAKLTDEKALEIYALAHNSDLSQKEIADMFGVKQSAVSSIKRGDSWVHVTKHVK